MAHPTLSNFLKKLGFLKKLDDDDAKDRNPLLRLHKGLICGPDVEPDLLLGGGEEELSFSYKGRMMPPLLSKCVLASAVTWLLLALCSSSLVYSAKFPFPCKVPAGANPTLPMPDKVDLSAALKALDDATSELLRTWDGVSSQTQNAFKENFLPKGATAKPGEGPLAGLLEGTPGGALAVYLHHVGTVKLLAEVTNNSNKEKRKAALLRRIKMVKTVVQLATQRLRGLDENGNFAVNNKIFSAVNNVELELPCSDLVPHPDAEYTSYEEYQEMVRGIGNLRFDGPGPKAGIPSPVAKKLVDTLRLKEMQLGDYQNLVSSLQTAILNIYGEGGEWTDDETGPVKGVALGPLHKPNFPDRTQGAHKGTLPKPDERSRQAEGPTDMQAGGPPMGPPGTQGGGSPRMVPAPHEGALTEVPLSHFKQVTQKFAYLGIEEMGRLQRERRLPLEWNTEAAVKHLKDINNSQKEYLSAVNGLKDNSIKTWEADLGDLTPYDLAVMALSLM